jgi:hypothetical protein
LKSKLTDTIYVNLAYDAYRPRFEQPLDADELKFLQFEPKDYLDQMLPHILENLHEKSFELKKKPPSFLIRRNYNFLKRFADGSVFIIYAFGPGSSISKKFCIRILR